MINLTKHIRLFLFLLGFFILQNTNAQTVTDSILKEITMSVYDQPDEAIQRSNELIEKHKDDTELKIKLLIIISNAYSSKRDYQKALEFALEAKENNKIKKNQSLQLQILNKIAAQYHQLGVNDKALQILDEADQLAANHPHPDSIRFVQGNNFAIRGFIYRDQLSCDIAIDYLNKAYDAYSVNKNDSRAWGNRSVINYNKGNCFVTLNQLDSAKTAYKNSGKLAKKASANSLQAFSMKGLAEVYTLEGNYLKALEVLDSAFVIAENVGDLVLNRGIYKGQSDNYLALKNWEKYQEVNQKFIASDTQLKNSERNTINTLLDTYRIESEENQALIKRNYGIGILISGLLFLLILYLIFKGEMKFQKEFNQLREKIKV